VLFTGDDPLTGRRRYATETHPTEALARKALNRMRVERDQDRIARTNALFSVALGEWMAVQELTETTRRSYEAYIRNHIGVGPRGRAAVQAERADAGAVVRRPAAVPSPLYARRDPSGPPRRRRAPVRPRPAQATAGTTADRVAGALVRRLRMRGRLLPAALCRPMSNATINRIHFIVSGALAAAVRWGWIATNPASVARKPRVPAPQPNPPTLDQVARILAAAWEDSAEWGTLVWLVMVTGLRRDELVALRWSDVDFDTETLLVRRGIVKVGSRVIEKDSKTHRMRRIALDPETVKVLQEHRARWDVQAVEPGLDALDDAFLFSYEPDQSRPLDPSGVTHRYSRMCAGLGIDSHLHALRHYSATELLGAGVDLRTVAGRLGHGGGGVTTLRVYAAFVAESDRRAADILASRMVRPSVRRTGGLAGEVFDEIRQAPSQRALDVCDSDAVAQGLDHLIVKGEHEVSETPEGLV
jgi:integrase